MVFGEYSNNPGLLWTLLEKDIFGTDSEIEIVTPHADSHKICGLAESDFQMQEQISRGGRYDIDQMIRYNSFDSPQQGAHNLDSDSC